jgi:hypothetical protein
MNWQSSFGRLAFILSIIVAFTSLIDLFVNRLLFRAGPEVLAHMEIPGLSELAVVGRISFTFEQMALYVILGSAAILLVSEGDVLPRYLGLLIAPQLVCAALLYFPIPMGLAWGVSMLLVLVTGIEVLGLLLIRALRRESSTGKQLAVRRAFLLTLALCFIFPIYYRASLLLSAINAAALPFEVGAYDAGVFMIMLAAVAALAYALVAPSLALKMNVRNFAKAAVLPTLLVGPILYGLMESYFMVQIFSLVIAMSTDITLSFELVRAIVFFWWVLLVAIVLLLLKGRTSRNRFLLQQGIGLVLILSTTFLFNYPNYLLLGTTGVLLVTYPLRSTQES